MIVKWVVCGVQLKSIVLHEKRINVLKDKISNFSSGLFSFLFSSFVISNFKFYNLSSINVQLDFSTTNEMSFRIYLVWNKSFFFTP